MAIEQTLVQFSWAFIVVISLLILVPYWFRRTDLLTSWNVFLLGSIVFVGTAGLMSGYQPERFRILEYRREDYELFMAGVLTFYGVLIAVYYLFKLPRRLGGKVLRTWPPDTVPVLFLMLAVTLVFAVTAVVPHSIPGVSQFLFQVGNKAIPIAVVLAFIAWFKQRTNVPLLFLFLGVMFLAVGFAVMIGGGRRSLIAVLAAVPVSLYWLHFRKVRPAVTLTVLGGCGVALATVVGAYSMVRHFDRRGERQERNFEHSLQAVANVPTHLFDFDIEPLLGQNAGQMSLAAIQLYTGDHEPAPFHSLKFVAVNWIPRTIWEDKPEGLGQILPRDAKSRTRATWGAGIVGHGFHEGGLHMLAFYALLVGAALRFWDELLKTQPENPYILGAYAAMFGHIFGWTRGDIGTFTIQIIGCVLAMLLLNIVGRVLFGGVRTLAPGTYPAVYWPAAGGYR
jgi:hypothetical protein